MSLNLSVLSIQMISLVLHRLRSRSQGKRCDGPRVKKEEGRRIEMLCGGGVLTEKNRRNRQSGSTGPGSDDYDEVQRYATMQIIYYI